MNLFISLAVTLLVAASTVLHRNGITRTQRGALALVASLIFGVAVTNFVMASPA